MTPSVIQLWKSKRPVKKKPKASWNRASDFLEIRDDEHERTLVIIRMLNSKMSNEVQESINSCTSLLCSPVLDRPTTKNRQSANVHFMLHATEAD